MWQNCIIFWRNQTVTTVYTWGWILYAVVLGAVSIGTPVIKLCDIRCLSPCNNYLTVVLDPWYQLFGKHKEGEHRIHISAVLLIKQSLWIILYRAVEVHIYIITLKVRHGAVRNENVVSLFASALLNKNIRFWFLYIDTEMNIAALV